MPGSIVPLPIMEEEGQPSEEALLELQPPSSVVVRYGYMRQIAELPYEGKEVPGCGSKLVIRTDRGIELAEMLTTTCENSGCSKAVSRKQMLEYVENSGGKDYPFSEKGKVLRIATLEDINEQARLDSRKSDMNKSVSDLIRELDLPMKLVDIELLLGGERIVFHYTSDEWVDFREMVRRLATDYQTRIEMRQVNARDEARLVADYEKCGQHCCCRQFLKVLKPVSMKAAKIQKATLDPTKISGRCGRLMCCLRYEQQTYDQLRKSLPNRKRAVLTEDGVGIVINTQILTQLVMLQMKATGKMQAYPVENIEVLDPKDPRIEEADARLKPKEEPVEEKVEPAEKPDDLLLEMFGEKLVDKMAEKKQQAVRSNGDVEEEVTDDEEEGGQRKSKRSRSRRNRRRRGGGDARQTSEDNTKDDAVKSDGGGESKPPEGAGSEKAKAGEGEGKKKRRRRRRRRKRGGGEGSGGGG